MIMEWMTYSSRTTNGTRAPTAITPAITVKVDGVFIRTSLLLAHQAAGPDEQNENEQQQREDGRCRRGDELRRHGLEHANHDSPDERTGDTADAAQHHHSEGLDAEGQTDAGRDGNEGRDQTAHDADHGATQTEGQVVDMGHVNARHGG